MSRSRQLLLALAVLTTSCSAPELPEAEVLSRAKILLDDAPDPQHDGDPRWRSVELTDYWRTARPHYGGFAWYRFDLPPPSDAPGPCAVYLPLVNMNAAVFLNGEFISSGGSLSEPVARNHNRPLYFSFPCSALTSARNQLDVRVFAYAHHGGKLGPVLFGPDNALRPVYRDRLLWQTQLPSLATALALVMALLICSFWVVSGFEGTYGFLALATGLWTLCSANYWVRDIPLDHWIWMRIVYSATTWFVVCLVLWAHRILGLKRRRTELTFLSLAAAMTAAVWLLPVARFYPAATWSSAATLALAGYLPLALILERSRLSRYEAWSLRILGASVLTLGAHDVFLMFQLRGPGSFYLLPMGVSCLLIALILLMTRRFYEAIQHAESLAAGLHWPRGASEPTRALARKPPKRRP